MIEFTQRDILRGKLVEPAWYKGHIESLEKKLAAKGDSTNYNYEITLLKNADNGDEKFAGVPVTVNFNTKAKGFMIGFFAAMGAEITAGARFNEDNAVGKDIELYITNEEYDGRMINKCKHQYRPVGADVSSVGA
jgi:hypothetical protein